MNVEGCCRGSWQWVDAGDIGDREIGGAQPALVSSQGRGKPSLGSRPGALGVSSVSGSGPGSIRCYQSRGQAEEARLSPVYGGQAVSRQLGSYPPLTNQRTSGKHIHRNQDFFLILIYFTYLEDEIKTPANP